MTVGRQHRCSRGPRPACEQRCLGEGRPGPPARRGTLCVLPEPEAPGGRQGETRERARALLTGAVLD